MRKLDMFVLSTSRPLRNEESAVIVGVTREMYHNKKTKFRFKSKNFEGFVWTEWKFGYLGQFSGIIIDAKIETGRCTKTLKSIVSTDDLKPESDLHTMDALDAPWNSIREFEELPCMN